MSVDRSEVSDPHLLKEHSGHHQRFDRLFGAADALDDPRNRVVERIVNLVPQLNIAVGRADLAQIAGQSSDIWRNGHIVVV